MPTDFYARLMKVLDAAVGPPVCRSLARAQRRACASTIDDHSGRLLVIRPGGIGDMLLLLPTLTRLRQRYPTRAIDLLCERRNAAPPQLAGLDVDILTYDRAPLQALAALRRRIYAAAIDSEQFHHFSAVMAVLSGAPIRIGFNVAPRRNGLYTHLADYELSGREDTQFARLALLAGCAATDPDPVFSGCLRHAALPELPEALARDARSPLLIAHAGGTRAAKRIPPPLLTEVCRRAQAELGLTVALVGGKSEASLAGWLKHRQPGLLDTCGQLSLAETAALCRRADVFLGPDSGITHLAAALGIPSVTLFGPTNPRKWAVGDAGQIVLCRRLPCEPCAIFGYTKPCTGLDCMQTLDPASVFQALQAQLTPA